jgi:hypothetical protein
MGVEAECRKSPIEEASVTKKLSDERVKMSRISPERKTEHRCLVVVIRDGCDDPLDSGTPSEDRA